MMPRVVYSMAMHHELPSALGRVHPQFRTPHVAIVLNAIVALTMSLYSSFAQAATFAAIARLMVFGSTCAALLALRRSNAPAPAFRLRGGTAIAIGGLVFSVWLVATRNSTELWILFAIVAAGAALFTLATRRGISARRLY
jgi:amino acid transporter